MAKSPIQKRKLEDVKIALTIDENKAIPHLTEILVEVIEAGVDFVVKNFQVLIIDGLIFGGKGWQGLVDTPAWKWINSTKGYGQLGFSNPLEPLNLLNALRKSWTVHKVKQVNMSGSIQIGFSFTFGDITALRQATIHPAAGYGKLPADRSWFDWVYSGLVLQEVNYHFTKTGPTKGSRSSVIAGKDAGLMKPGGLWQVTPRFRIDFDRLITHNEEKMTSVIQHFIQAAMAEETR